MQRLGQTRSSHQPDHLVLSQETFVRAPLPGMTNATAIVHVGPAAGARFAQYTAELNADGVLGPTLFERFVYVLEGEADAVARDRAYSLQPGGYAFFPAGVENHIHSHRGARLAVIEKAYQAVEGTASPEPIAGNERTIAPLFMMDDPWVEMRCLLPADDRFDCAVNTMTFRPGASLPMVEAHVMEHGLLMLEGGGIYRLGERWYPVTEGDFIWMGPYCPQWFGAIGKTQAKYLIYKDFNRAPL